MHHWAKGNSPLRTEETAQELQVPAAPAKEGEVEVASHLNRPINGPNEQQNLWILYNGIAHRIKLNLNS